jgi:hypothetical protein
MSQEEITEKAEESKYRRLLRRQGYLLRKSRRGLGLNNQGGYMIVDAERNYIAAGQRFEMFLDDLREWVKE